MMMIVVRFLELKKMPLELEEIMILGVGLDLVMGPSRDKRPASRGNKSVRRLIKVGKGQGQPWLKLLHQEKVRGKNRKDRQQD